MESVVYNQKGKEVGKVTLPESIFGLPWNADLVHQVVVSMQANKRRPIAHSKNRGEVRGGGKKPWQQKGTGRARHGSIRSPLWVGGGVTHGPRNEKIFGRKINKKMAVKALFTVLAKKWSDKEILFLDALKMPAPKTKEAKQIVLALGGIAGFAEVANRRQNAAAILLPTRDQAVARSFKNFSTLSVSEARNANALDLLNYKYVVIVNPDAALAQIASRGSKKETK